MALFEMVRVEDIDFVGVLLCEIVRDALTAAATFAVSCACFLPLSAQPRTYTE